MELVGPTVVDDLRGNPTHALGLREAAARLDSARALTSDEARDFGDELTGASSSTA